MIDRPALGNAPLLGAFLTVASIALRELGFGVGLLGSLLLVFHEIFEVRSIV